MGSRAGIEKQPRSLDSGPLLMGDPYCTVYGLWSMRWFASLHSILNCSIDPVNHKVHFTITDSSITCGRRPTIESTQAKLHQSPCSIEDHPKQPHREQSDHVILSEGS